MTAKDILSKFDHETYKRGLEAITFKLNEVSVTTFKRHVCVDCGVPLSTFGAVRCRSCHMRRIGAMRKK